MDRVFATRTVKGIKIALSSMPQRIDELYRLTLERIQQQAGDDGMLAMRILSWITHARRPLSVNELRHGLAVEYDDDDDFELSAYELDADNLLQPESLVDVCAGLVIIDSTSQIIRLVHYTTQEYFSNTRLDLFAEAEADMSRACLTYLSYDIGHRYSTQEIATKALQLHPFLDYASSHWFSHANSILLAGTPTQVFLNFVAPFKCSDNILRSINLLSWQSQHRIPRFVHDPNPGCPDRESALELASIWGLEELVTILLDHSTGSFPGLDRSLFFASRSGALDIVNLLLRYGAQVNFILHAEAFGADTALWTACENGHLPVAKVLIKNGANPCVGKEPVMHDAALMDKPVVVDFLIKEGVNVNARDSRKRTALRVAASYDRVDVVKLLLDAHCALDLKDDDGYTALYCAVHYDNVESVKLLLDAHCDPDLKGYNGGTALHSATRDKSVDMVQLLLDAHCALDIQDNDGCTALHYAARNSHVDVVKLLLHAHCDLNLKNNDGCTALHSAAYTGSVEVVKLLLDTHCNLGLKDNDGTTALHYAACAGRVDVVRLLLDAHCDLSLKDKNEFTALHSAAPLDTLDAIEMLLDRDADASVKNTIDETARNVLENNFPRKPHPQGEILYEREKREKTEGLIQGMTQLEQPSSAPPADEP